MNYVDWTMWVSGVALSLAALAFAIYQYFNKRFSPKIQVVRKALRLASAGALLLLVAGYLVIWMNPASTDLELRALDSFGEPVDNISFGVRRTS